MILTLDHAIFGNGFGMKSPYCDDKFYWLSGQLYTFMHGLGCQLHSYQWMHPHAGERRKLADRDFVIFSSRRRGARVECAWAMVCLPDDLDKAHCAIRALKADLDRL